MYIYIYKISSQRGINTDTLLFFYEAGEVQLVHGLSVLPPSHVFLETEAQK